MTVEFGVDGAGGSERAEFMFRNLVNYVTVGYCSVLNDSSYTQYTRYRRGNCTFLLSSTAQRCPVEWKHSFDFSTYPG